MKPNVFCIDTPMPDGHRLCREPSLPNDPDPPLLYNLRISSPMTLQGKPTKPWDTYQLISVALNVALDGMLAKYGQVDPFEG